MAGKKRKKKKKGSIALKIILWILMIIVAIGCVGGAVVLGVYNGARNSAPELTETNVISAMYPSSIYDINGKEMIQLSSEGARRTEATSEEIPDALRWAFIDLEDERFYEHKGIDFKGLVRAAYVTFTSDRNEGASTITQQLIKNNVFETGGFERSTGSTVKRKIQEWKLAMELEKKMSKEEILLTYLNTIFLGSGNYGVKEAASYYFGKKLDALSISECAVIAAITQNPSANNPVRFPENNWKRASKSIENMHAMGHITDEEYKQAINDNVYDRIIAVAGTNAGDVIYSYYIDALIEQVSDHLQDRLGYTSTQAYNAIYAGGLQIYSNQDPGAQKIIDKEINDTENYVNLYDQCSILWDITIKHKDGSVEYFNHNHVRNYYKDLYGNDWYMVFDSHEEADQYVNEYKQTIMQDGDEIIFEQIYYTIQPQASFSLMDWRDGRVLAINGGRGVKETSMSMNRATNTYKQPGSTFKIVSAFAPAIDIGACTLATTFDDEPFKYGDSGKQIRNWWGDSYRGLSTLRLGIRDSMNIVACKTLLYIGASRCIPYLQSFGYSMIGDYDAAMSTAIGGITYGITNLENCAAFAAIANDGVYNEPMFYSKVIDRDGKVLLDAETVQDVHQVISLETASLLTDAMRDVVTDGTAVQCAIDSAPLAGKTGTTNDYRDLWFVGYVPNGLCSAIWIGFDENKPVSDNNEAQKRFYSIIMDQLVQQQHAEGGEFEMKGNIVQAAVCRKSGQLPSDLCSSDPDGDMIHTEYFAAGTVPDSSCAVHVSVKVCEESGKLAGEYCPEESVVEKVFRRRIDGIDDGGNNGGSGTPDDEYTPPEDECDIHTADGKVIGTDKHGNPIYETSEETTEEEKETKAPETEAEGGDDDGGDD